MRRIAQIVPIVALVAASIPALIWTPATAAEPGGLALSAIGEVQMVPDVATVTLGVVAEGTTAAAAMAQDAALMAQVFAALARQGVPERDVQTANLAVSAQYAFPQGQPRRLTGYQASNQVIVTVRALSRLGAVLDAAAGSGANEINGVSFGVRDPAAAQDAARLKAVAALKAKADLYARATGSTLGRLVSLSEGGGYAPAPVRPMAMMAMAKRVETPIEAGELTVRIEVSGFYELK